MSADISLRHQFPMIVCLKQLWNDRSKASMELASILCDVTLNSFKILEMNLTIFYFGMIY